MDLVRIMVLLLVACGWCVYDRPGATVGAGGAPGSGRLVTAPSRAEGGSGMGSRPRLRPCGPQAPGRESPTPAAESRPNPTVAGGRRPLAWGASPVFPTRVRACRCDDHCAWTG